MAENLNNLDDSEGRIREFVSLDQVKKLDLRTAKIIEADDHPNADKLLVLKVDTGYGNIKEIVAGIKNSYTKETLIGKTIVLVNNLKPCVIRGVTSCGMLLAAKSDNNLTILTTDLDVPAGSIVS